MANCHHIFTHNDLDGAGSLLVYMWNQPKDDAFQYTPISNLEVSKLKKDISNTHNQSNIHIFDLPLRDEFLPELDNSGITFVDHHKSSEKFINKFQKSKVFYKEYSSNTLLLYKLYKEEHKLTATDEQKTLVALIDDFDSYKMEIPASTELNMLFWSEYQSRFSDFVKDYYNGFKPFNEKQKKAISFLKKEAETEASNLPIFSGILNIQGKPKKIFATIAEKITPNATNVLIKKINPDIFFSINTKTERVFIRQIKKENPIDCSAFAEKYCEGGGHSNTAGGIITPVFMEIAKNLNPV